MRYPKGSIQLNQSRDLPLLRQILRSEFVTHSQLFEFMQLNHYEHSRNSFDWRMRRLVARGLALRQTLLAGLGEVVYSVTSSAAALLQSMGEHCLIGPIRSNARHANRNALHAIGLNEIHLSALRAHILLRWTGAMEIRSQNELTRFGFAKDYDAIVLVGTDYGEQRFALEYERTPKTAKSYRAIAACINREIQVRQVLYLVPNYDLLRFVSGFFGDAQKRVYFGLVRDWHAKLLDMPVSDYSVKRQLRFREAFSGAAANAGAIATSQLPLSFH
jgi:hypothetical protein